MRRQDKQRHGGPKLLPAEKRLGHEETGRASAVSNCSITVTQTDDKHIAGTEKVKYKTAL